MIVISAGVPSSASTWVSNIARGLMEGRGTPVHRFADSLLDLRLLPTAAVDLFVKCHHPKHDLVVATVAGGTRTILTIRDPRDCVVSLMQRFGRTFEHSLRDVASSLAHLDALPLETVMLLRYEDRFFEKAETIEGIGAFIGTRPSADRVKELAHKFSTSEVSAVVATIPGLPQEAVEVHLDSTSHLETGFHINHITDTLSGKYERLLTARQIIIAEGALFFALDRYGYRPDADLVMPQSFSATDAGRPKGDVIEVLDGAGDCAVFGPYINLPAGTWSARFLTEATCPVDIAIGQKTAAGGRSDAALAFEVGNPADSVEFRVFTIKQGNTFRGVRLRREGR